MQFSPEFKSNQEVTEQPVIRSSKRKQVFDMNEYIRNADTSFQKKGYRDAVFYYTTATSLCPNDYPKAELYRKIALSHTALGKQDKVQASRYELLTNGHERNRKESAKRFRIANRYLKKALREDKENQNNIDQIRDHFELVKIYIITNKFRKALQNILAGMELNLARKPEHECMLDAADKEGHAILLAFLDKVPQKRWAIPYHEQVITMLKKCQAKYPNSGFEETIKSAEIKLEALKILPPDDAPERPCRVLFSRKNEENANGLNTDRFVRPDVGSLLLKGSMFSINLDLADKMILEPVAKKQNTSLVPSSGESERQGTRNAKF